MNYFRYYSENSKIMNSTLRNRYETAEEALVSLTFLHALWNVCYENEEFPECWIEQVFEVEDD